MEEWGPWIENDGLHPQEYGAVYAQWQFERPVTRETNPRAVLLEDKITSEGWTTFSGRSWRGYGGFMPIIRYRIRKPRGMAILEALLQDLPQDVEA